MTLIEPFPSMAEVCRRVGRDHGLDLATESLEVGLREAQFGFLHTFYADCATFTSEGITKDLWAEFMLLL